MCVCVEYNKLRQGTENVKSMTIKWEKVDVRQSMILKDIYADVS
jgi:hypothetical protein